MRGNVLRWTVLLGIVLASGPVARSQSAAASGDVKAAGTASPALSHTLDGVWVMRLGDGLNLVDPMLRPPMTPWGQARFDAAVPSLGPRVVSGKENDPVLKCDPDGIPKILTSPEPFEIFTVPGRVLMTFEKDHNWRQIWADGRKLPEDPEPAWNGYSVGRWEGDTFVVESTGFNDIPWLDYYGDPHSEALHLTERYQRINHDTLSMSVTIDDPKAYTKPWVGKPKLFNLKPDWEIIEYFCTVEDVVPYDQQVRLPAGGVTPSTDNKNKDNPKK